MKFGVGIDYSLKALLMLAERYPTVQPLRVEEIASREGIPENYLRRLLIDLKRAGLVASQKGPSGGYMLARSPGQNHDGGRGPDHRGRLHPGRMLRGRRQLTMPARRELCDARGMARGSRRGRRDSAPHYAPIARPAAQDRPAFPDLSFNLITKVRYSSVLAVFLIAASARVLNATSMNAPDCPSRQDIGDLIVLRVCGSYYEMGRQQVELLNGEAPERYSVAGQYEFQRRAWTNAAPRLGIGFKLLDWFSVPSLAWLGPATDDSGFYQEIRGIGDGIGVGRADAFRFWLGALTRRFDWVRGDPHGDRRRRRDCRPQR